MKTKYLVLVLLYFPCLIHANTTVTSRFVITNRTIESATIQSTDTSAVVTNAGNGLYRISDNYQSIRNRILTDTGNHQVGFWRKSSIAIVTMTGQNLGHTFTVLGKYADSEISVSTRSSAGFDLQFNNGCSFIDPFDQAFIMDTPRHYKIQSDSDVSKDCVGRTKDVTHQFNGPPIVNGVSRTFYLDIGRLQTDPEYKKAPPDIYFGSGVYTGEVVKNRVGVGFAPSYINNITIVKNPFFENVTLPIGDNVFDTRTTGGDILGSLVIPYVINGHFTPYNTISLQVHSSNGFKLQMASGGSTISIPYSLSTTIGSQRVYPLVTNGAGLGAVTIRNLEVESYSIQGRFNANFSIDKNTAITGVYSDDLTAIFQIAL